MAAKRGRKSAEESNITVLPGGLTDKPPQAPLSLSARQMDIWNRVIATEPPGFFNTEAMQALLADYCRHRDAADTLSREINGWYDEWIKKDDGSVKYDRLLRMRDRESKAARSCATKLRLTNQSRYSPRAAGSRAGNQPSAPKPWEVP